MKIFEVKLPGEPAKYFLHEDSLNRYVLLLQECKDKGGNVKFTTRVIDVDEREPIEVTPLFDAYNVSKVWEAEVVIFKGTMASCKVIETVDIILGYTEPALYTHSERWLARCTRGKAKSRLSEDHAVSLAKTAALELYKLLAEELGEDVQQSSEVHQDN